MPAAAQSGNRYELALILRATLDDEAKTAQMDQITQLLGRFGATIEKVDEWGRRRLAYEIAKQNEGIYYFITFSSDASVPAEIESRVRIMENLLRYLIIRIEE
ncbi:MAG: 30S ribosomal protein S6 [Defluviitaleaceae bacterium]|nr:30S ribosomal protein S6 [Defluviitaleaceae bacterium]